MLKGDFSELYWYFENLSQRNFASALISFKFLLYNKQTNVSTTSSVSKLGKFSFSLNLENTCKIVLLEPRNAF